MKLSKDKFHEQKGENFEIKEKRITNKIFTHLFLYAIFILIAVFLCACHSHNYEVIEEVEATCLTSGHKTYQCKECGDTYTRDDIPGSHEWVEATCTAPRTCKICGETMYQALDHNIDSTGKCELCGKQVVSLSNQLPSTFSYTYYSGTYTKVKITDVSFSWFKGSLTVNLKGQKTYDWKGEIGTTTARVLVVIKNSEGNIVGSEEVYNMDLVEGQAFNKSAYFSGLSRDKSYTIELRNSSV